ncbi:MAG: hypothetical protein WAS94_02225 [Candidatus Saccharimonadales bacterium]
MQTSADLSLISIFAVIASVVYLFKLHQGFLVLSLSSGIYFIQSLGLKSAQLLAVNGVSSALQQQLISAILISLPIIITVLKFRGKSKLSSVKSVIGSVIVAAFFTITAGTYLPLLKSLINGPLFIQISSYSFQIGLASFIWMSFVYLAKQSSPEPVKKK